MPSAITSATDICNLALAQIAGKRINSVESDESEEAKACRLQYQHTVNTVLERHQWDHATRRAGLSRVSVDPATEWDAAWNLPNDYIRFIRIVGADPDNPVRFFAIEGRQLLTRGGTSVDIVYVTNSNPVTHWPSLFIDAVVFKLAASIAGTLQKAIDVANAMTQKYESLGLPVAQTADAKNTKSGENFGPRQLASMSALVNARFRADGRPPYTPHI